MAEELRNEAQRSNGGGRIMIGVDLEEKEAGGVDEAVGWEGFFVEVEGPRRGREGCGIEGRERKFVQRRMERREEQSWEQYKCRESDERVTQTLFRRRMERSEKWIFSMELSNFDLVVRESHYQDNSLWTKGG